MMRSQAREAFRVCEQLARRHYENFPVGRFLPQPARERVAAVYAFARVADDIADEPPHPSPSPFHGEGWGEDRVARLRALDDWEAQLRRCAEGRSAAGGDHPVFIALSETIETADLPLPLFMDLLTAFRMDVEWTRPKTFDDLLRYCRYSANPIGRLVLLICGQRDPALLAESDAICTALQLTNFWQDLRIDLDRGRCYLPEDDLASFVAPGSSETDLMSRRMTPALRAAITHEVEATRRLFAQGRGLPSRVRGRLRLELRLVWLGGMRILDRIEAAGYDVFRRRPVISAADKIRLLTHAVLSSWTLRPTATP